MNYCVYKHTSPNGKVYIGITCKKPEYRWNNGRGYWQNSHFTSAIQKYGWENFSHEILFSGLSKEEAEAKEIELIAKYNSANREKGYNHEIGGCTNGKTSEETKRKISESRKGKCTGAKHPKYGKCVVCVETGVTYNSLLEVERQLKINKGNVVSCCTGKRKKAGGFTWRYAV